MPDYPSYSDPQHRLIARFANPHEDLDYQVKLVAENFSVLDPESGKPAYATLEFSYFPGEWWVDHPALAGGEGPAQAPSADRVAEVGDGDRGGEPARPLGTHRIRHLAPGGGRVGGDRGDHAGAGQQRDEAG